MPKKPDPFRLLTSIFDLIEEFAKIPTKALSQSRAADFRSQSALIAERLNVIANEVDPVSVPSTFDPSDPRVVGNLIAHTLLEQSRVPLAELTNFHGSGVYALYYHGSFGAYAPLRRTEHPIYVGMAEPQNESANTVFEQGQRLYRRLGDHSRSIRQATNISPDDFDCRYLVVKSHWQSTAEQYLIERFRPIWNMESNVCYGFGKHGDSSKTRANSRSPWDTIHPGRPWAGTGDTKPNDLSEAEILANIGFHFGDHPPERSVPPTTMTIAGE